MNEVANGRNAQDSAARDLQRIIESARRLGVEVDEAEALAWLCRPWLRTLTRK